MLIDAVLWIALFTGTPLAAAHAELLPKLTPFAERVGMQQRGAELADASFRLLQPADHAGLVARLPSAGAENAALSEVHDLLARLSNGVVTSRTKSLYSTWSKAERKGIDVVPDRLATRVRVATVEECYALLADLHERYAHDPDELDDYIANPKANGYSSIHTVLHVPTVDGPLPVEVQLRTHAMHAHAEHGDAAHWQYKLS